MSVFDKDLFATGLAKRKATLGEKYVEQSLAIPMNSQNPSKKQ
tara:strand:+ start:315 stop:443 length:129 start_codon:yes stop_codon:yes gene_type:complete